jgi:hypothetical protein
MRRNSSGTYRCTRVEPRAAIDPEEVERYRAELAEVSETMVSDRIRDADALLWLRCALTCRARFSIDNHAHFVETRLKKEISKHFSGI